METIRVIIIDEQPLFREGIRATLQRMGDCEIVGESTDAADVLEIARTCNPDVALIDAGLTASDPLEIARQMRHSYRAWPLLFSLHQRMKSAYFSLLRSVPPPILRAILPLMN
ncbi:response regulator transcription factor [Dictyobacter kobayashii]|uniref:Response regulatory domain-containing protein n=1 Tax=Dictyobacter kobayashii TaxID=2014872 RepID=A0A402AEC2_9CHLR|nr:response regulator [Dictyobacter kobayashii]GCE17449.1 hypothetical protein KDK_12490 [Dictyobacter kobayashii]